MFSPYFLVLTDSLVLTEWMMNLYSPASAATDMDIDKTPDDEETTDAATSKASKSARLEFIWTTGLFVSYSYDFLCLLKISTSGMLRTTVLNGSPLSRSATGWR